MRPTANPQSTLRMPLNDIMGTEANVRVLRVLAERETPTSAAAISRRAQLQRSTVSRALRTLEESGVVEYVGIAPQVQAILRERGPLARAIRQLFDAERARFDALLDGLKNAAARVPSPPMSVWIGGSAALGSDRPGDQLTVYLLDKPDWVAVTAQLLRMDLGRLEKKLDVTIDVQEFTLADLATTDIPHEELSAAIVVLGVPPLSLAQRVRKVMAKAEKRSRIKSHAELDARTLSRAKEVADAIRKDPSVIHRARAYVEKRWHEASPGERKELAEWRRILRTVSPASLRKLLVDTSERATRLRQTLPFLGVLEDR